jgi:hypothetical protein
MLDPHALGYLSELSTAIMFKLIQNRLKVVLCPFGLVIRAGSKKTVALLCTLASSHSTKSMLKM